MIAPALFVALSLVGFSLLPLRRARVAIPLSLSIGALAVGWTMWLMGYLIGTTAALVAAALLFASSLRRFAEWRIAVTRFGRELGLILRRPATLLPALLLLALLPQLAAPLVDSDGLRYHAALPKLFLLQGEVSFYPYDLTGAFPQLAEMLYMIGIAAGVGETAKVLHFLFFTATLAVVVLLVHRSRGTRTAAVLAAFLFAAGPVALVPAGAAFIDHFAVFHLAVALLAGRHAALPLAAAFATKITAAPAVFALMIGRGVKPFVLSALVVAGVFAPFAIRNVIHTGDPVHPVGRGLLGMPVPGVSPEATKYVTEYYSKLEGIVAIAWLPQRGVVHDDDVAGLHHLFGLFALVLAVRERRLRAPLAIVLAFLAVALVYRPAMRLFLPMFLALSIFEGAALARLRRFAPAVALVAALPALWVALPLVLTLETEPARAVPGYRAAQLVNRLPDRGKVMALDFPAPYYFNRPWIAEGLVNEPPLEEWLRDARTPDDLLARLERAGVHLLVVTPGYGGGGPHTLVAMAADRREAVLLDGLRRRLRLVGRVDSVDVFEVP